MFHIIIPILGLVLFIISSYIMLSIEKFRWNNGFCRCGGKWRLTTKGLFGSRVYECPDCDSELWVTTGVDKYNDIK